MARRQQNPWTPETKTGVNYFKHQTKHFLTPYGKTHGLLTSREILDKLFHWNCEWLTRPNYAISELCDTLYSNMATLSDYRDKVFTRHAVDPLLTKARPIRTVLQRFNKKDSTTAEEPDERDLADLMKFVEDDHIASMCKHMFAASGAMFSIATHLMTLQTLFSHPAESAKRHRESPEVQGFKQNPSRESMVAYVAAQTLSHTDIAPEDEGGNSIWDTLSPRSQGRHARSSLPFWEQEEVEADEEQYEDEEDEEDLQAPLRKRRRQHVFDEDDEDDQQHEPFTTPESSQEHALFITQADPEEYHEEGTLSRAEKGKRPASRKRGTAPRNVWAAFGVRAATPEPGTSTAQNRRGTSSRARATRATGRGTTRGRSRGSRAKKSTRVNRHIHFED